MASECGEHFGATRQCPVEKDATRQYNRHKARDHGLGKDDKIFRAVVDTKCEFRCPAFFLTNAARRSHECVHRKEISQNKVRCQGPCLLGTVPHIHPETEGDTFTGSSSSCGKRCLFEGPQEVIDSTNRK